MRNTISDYLKAISRKTRRQVWEDETGSVPVRVLVFAFVFTLVAILVGYGVRKLHELLFPDFSLLEVWIICLCVSVVPLAAQVISERRKAGNMSELRSSDKARRPSIPDWRDESGQSSLEAPIAAVALLLVSCGFAFVLANVLPDGFFPAALPWGTLLVVACIIGIFSMMWGIAHLKDARDLAQLRAEDGAKLVRWLRVDDASELADYDLRAWQRAKENGLTEEVADQWDAAGYSFKMADSARSAGLPLDMIQDIAEKLRINGLWDGHDRRALDHMIAAENVLADWATFASEDVHRVVVALRAAKAEEVANDPHGQPKPVQQSAVFLALIRERAAAQGH